MPTQSSDLISNYNFENHEQFAKLQTFTIVVVRLDLMHTRTCYYICMPWFW